MGINTRSNNNGMTAGPGQSNLVLHAPPVVPDDLETFSHTGVIPTTYAQLNFSEGEQHRQRQRQHHGQAGQRLGELPRAGQSARHHRRLPELPAAAPPTSGCTCRRMVGAFTTRYGSPGEYDEGRYGTPLIAQHQRRGRARHPPYAVAHDLVIMAEEGLHGQTNKASSRITPDVWNNFADPGVGSTFVAHAHLGVGYREAAHAGRALHSRLQSGRPRRTERAGRANQHLRRRCAARHGPLRPVLCERTPTPARCRPAT